MKRCGYGKWCHGRTFILRNAAGSDHALLRKHEPESEPSYYQSNVYPWLTDPSTPGGVRGSVGEVLAPCWQVSAPLWAWFWIKGDDTMTLEILQRCAVGGPRLSPGSADRVASHDSERTDTRCSTTKPRRTSSRPIPKAPQTADTRAIRP